jgi:hypothetical protein
MSHPTIVESVTGEYHPEIVRISRIFKRLTSRLDWNGWCRDEI